MEQILLAIPQAAARVAIGRAKFYQLLQRNEIRTVRIGRRRLVPVSELDRYVERLQADAD